VPRQNAFPTTTSACLDIEGIVTLAKATGVEAIHPGYGFLSENAEFARACARAGITSVGPRPELLDMMGDKTAARALAQRLGVPTLNGTEEPIADREEALKIARGIGFPLIIKAAFGGGGRGMRVVNKASDLPRLLDEAQAEASRAFGNPAVFLEKYIPRAKHIEVQVLGDQHGNVTHLRERDCSVQRRHQKIIEVAPNCQRDQRTGRVFHRWLMKSSGIYGSSNSSNWLEPVIGRRFMAQETIQSETLRPALAAIHSFSPDVPVEQHIMPKPVTPS